MFISKKLLIQKKFQEALIVYSCFSKNLDEWFQWKMMTDAYVLGLWVGWLANIDYKDNQFLDEQYKQTVQAIEKKYQEAINEGN